MTFDSTHWFWFLLTAAVVVWYSSVTIFVAIRGAFDIRGMLSRLGESHRKRAAASDESTTNMEDDA